MSHLLVHFLAHEIVEVTDSPSAVAKTAARVLLGSPWTLHDSVHRHECQHTDVAHGLTPRIAWLLSRLADGSRASVMSGSPALTPLPARRSSHSHTLPFNLQFLRTSSRCASRLFNALRINLRRLLANFRGIDDEFEWIGVLILFHQFQIGESPGALYGLAAGKLRLCRFE